MNSVYPLQKMESPYCPSDPMARPKQRKKKTVLLVEDEPFLREITCDVLESAGYRVFKASEARAAMALFRKHRNAIDLLLSDVVLGTGNGYDMAKTMRKTGAHLHVILTSGHMWNAVAKNELGDKRMFYLPKPFSTTALLTKIDQILHASQYRDPTAQRRRIGSGRCKSAHCGR
jgi:DNA-binding NtrC family response regulator